MASPAPEPITDAPAGASSQPKPRRTIFKNRKPRILKTAEEEAADAVDFFSRSKEVFPKAIQEQREKREREERKKREEEAARKQRLEEEEEEEAQRDLEIQEERNQRRFLVDNGGSANEWNDEGRVTRSKSRSYSPSRPSRSVTPPLHRFESSASFINPLGISTLPPAKRRSRSPQNQRRTRSSRANKAIISLSSDEDEDDDVKLGKQLSVENGNDYDKYASSSPKVAERKRSPSSEPADEEEEMFPELVELARAQEAKEKAAKLKAMLSRNKSASSHGSGSPRDVSVLDSPLPLISSPLATRDLPKEDPVISILVSSQVDGLGAGIIVKRKLGQRFKDVRMVWCDKQLIAGHRSLTAIEKDRIFLTWRGRRVWDVTTAESLGIRVNGRGQVVDEKGFDLGGNVHLEAWTQETFDAYQKERKRERARLEMGTAERIDLDDDDDLPAEEEAMQEASAPIQIEKIKIVLKPKEGEAVKLIVKPSTVVATIVQGFKVQRPALCEGKTVELWFEGDRLEEESTVEEADVDDMCTIDVVLKDA